MPRRDPAAKSLSTLLYEELEEAEVFQDERGQAHVRIREPDRARHLRVRSKPFQLWLCRRAIELTGDVPGSGALAAVALAVEARAQHSERVTLGNRVARGPDGAVWLDLANPEGEAVRVSEDGFEVRPAPALFHRYSHQRPLPRPAPRGDLRGLLRFLNLRCEGDEVLFLASMVAALVPEIPQPILILHGPQGAAKTTAARLRRALIDPSEVPTVMVRRDLGELMQALDHHHSPIFDNLTRLSPLQEEVLCQAATGAAFTKRALYTDQEDVMFRLRRQVVLTGIDLPSVAADLLDRSVLIELERIPADRRQDEVLLWRDFEAERPALLAGLLGALAEALRLAPQLCLERLGRMADFTRLGTAAAMALGYEGSVFLRALNRNHAQQAEVVVDGDLVAEGLRALAERSGTCVGTATELLAALHAWAGSEARRRGLPQRPSDLARRLNLLQAPLEGLGLLVLSERSNDPGRHRIWCVATREAVQKIRAEEAARSSAP